MAQFRIRKRYDPSKDPTIPALILAHGALEDKPAQGLVASYVGQIRVLEKCVLRLAKRGFFEHEAQIEATIQRGTAMTPSEVGDRTRFAAALQKDATRDFLDAIDKRLELHEGKSNITIGIGGRTGRGKSSMAASLAERMGMRVEDVTKQVTYSKPVWLRCVKHIHDALGRGEDVGRVVMRDENDPGVGIGSMTAEKNHRAHLETMREAGISFIECGAGETIPTGYDLNVEVLGMSYQEEKIMGIYCAEGQILGRVEIPWSTTPFWEGYQEAKKKAVEDRKNLRNPNGPIYRAEALDLILDADVRQRLIRGRLSQQVCKTEVTEAYGAVHSSNELQIVTDRLQAVLEHYPMERAGNAEEFMQAVMDLIEQGLPMQWPVDREAMAALAKEVA